MIGPGDIETRPFVEGESLYGLVADVTGFNQLGRVAEVAGVADRTYGHRPQIATTGWDDLPALAAVLDVDVVELRYRSYPTDPDNAGRRVFFGTTVARGDITTRVRRFSPAALAKQPFHRAMWQLRIPVDDETGEILLSDCPVCRRTQRWRHSAGVAFCDGCGESLRQPAETVDAALLEDLRLAIGLTHSDPKRRLASLSMLPEEVARLGPAMAYELLIRLVPVVERACSWCSSQRIWHNGPHEIARGMTGAWRMLSGWPATFRERVSADLAPADVRYDDGNGGATRRFLGLRKSHAVAPSIRRLIGRLYGSMDIAGPVGAEIRRGVMTGGEVSSYLRLSVQTVVPLRRRGAFRTVGVARANVLVPAFDRMEVVGIERDIRRRLDLDRVNPGLGLPYYAVEQLCAMGHLPLLPHPFFAMRYVELQTTKSAMSTLLHAIHARAGSDLEGAEDVVRLMRMIGGRLKPWDAVVEAMLEGSLPYVIREGPPKVFRRICVRRADIVPLLQLPIARNGASSPLMDRVDPGFRFSDRMTKQDACEVLNFSRSEVDRLLDMNFASATHAGVLVGDVLALGRRFVTNAEIAARLGISYMRVHRAAAAAGIGRIHDAVYDRDREADIVEATMGIARSTDDTAEDLTLAT